MNKRSIVGIQPYPIVTSLWKALASASDDRSEVAIDQQSQKS